MTSWKKPLIEIIIVIVLFSLLAELILGRTIGYGTEGRGKFKDGLFIEGDFEYRITNLVITGEEWEVNFYNLSNIYIRFFDYDDELFEGTFITSNLTVITTTLGDPLPFISLDNITNISRFTSATFPDEHTSLQLTCSPDNQIIGTINTSTDDDYFTFRSVIVITDNETIEVLRRGRFSLYGENEGNVQFNISVNESCLIRTSVRIDEPNGDIIHLNGELRSYSFEGLIRSNGEFYFSNDPILNGNMQLKILQYPKKYYNHDAHQYDWELEIVGEDVVVEGFGLPFWSIGLILSIIPSVIIVAYHLHKKLLKEKEKFRK